MVAHHPFTLALPISGFRLLFGCTPKGSYGNKEGSKKVLGTVLGKDSGEGFSEGFSEGGLLWVLQKKWGSEKGSQKGF